MRIGTSSYIIDDSILGNVKFLSDKVDDIELILFETEEQSNIPDRNTIQELAKIAYDTNLSYTVHFPLDMFIGSSDKTLRNRAVNTCKHIIELTHGLSPFGYVLHLTPDKYGIIPSDNIPLWVSYLDDSIEQILETGTSSVQFCAETLSYPFELVHPLVKKNKLSVTLDIGHIWLMGFDEGVALDLLPESRIVHLHGVSSVMGEDHQSLLVQEFEKTKRFITAVLNQEKFDGKERVLTLEVFDFKDFTESLEVVEAIVYDNKRS